MLSLYRKNPGRTPLANTVITALILLPAILIASMPITAQTEKHLQLSPARITFVSIPAGEFIMGTEDLAEAIADLPEPKAAIINDETPAHKVIFRQPFLLSETEVTQKQWLDVMGSHPGPAKNWQRENWQQLPVVSVSWHDANAFINKLNQLSGDYHYRLPTEAEWEYAARAGSPGLRPFSRLAMDEYAWYLHSSNDEAQPVASLKANDWGLYDMYGNAWEWVSDWYQPDSYSHAETVNPGGPLSGTKKIRRGGSYHCPPHLIRPAYRAADLPDKAYSVLGFRLVAENTSLDSRTVIKQGTQSKIPVTTQ